MLCCLVLPSVPGCTAVRQTTASRSTRHPLAQIEASQRTAAVHKPPPAPIVRFQSGDLSIRTSEIGTSYCEFPNGEEQLFFLPEWTFELPELTRGRNERSQLATDPGRSAGFACVLSDIGTNVGSDYRNFYSRRNLPVFAALIGLGAYFANTEIDQNVLEHVQDNITYHQNDEYQEFVEEYRFFGEGYLLIPVYFGTSMVGKYLLSEYEIAERIGQWADRSFRGVVVGTPPLLLSQYIIGASRPGESSEGSEWQFLSDSNGVSGHAFMGAIPFISAAEMTDDPITKSLLYVVSALPALSRVTENDHYPSQAILGWSLACVACRSVSQTELRSGAFQVQPWISNAGVGMGVNFQR